MDFKVFVAFMLLLFLFLVPESKAPSRQNGEDNAENQDYYNELVDIINVDEELNKSYTGIKWQVISAISGTFLGGVVSPYLRGRAKIGCLIGGIFGGFFGYFTSGSYQPVPYVIKKMTHDKRMELVTKVKKLVGNMVLTEFVAPEANRALFRKLIIDIIRGQ